MDGKSSPEEALAQAIAFVQGVGDADPDMAAAYIIEQLARRGYSVQPISAPILYDLEPGTLGRVRSALGITRKAMAAETGLNVLTVSRAENPNWRSHETTRRAIGDALVRLGARRPE